MIQLTLDDYLFRKDAELQRSRFIYNIYDLALKQMKQREESSNPKSKKNRAIQEAKTLTSA